MRQPITVGQVETIGFDKNGAIVFLDSSGAEKFSAGQIQTYWKNSSGIATKEAIGAGAEGAADTARLRVQISAEEAVGVRMPTEISGYTQHGLNQAISRDGVGVSGEAILNTWKNPSKIEYIPTTRGPSFRLTGPDAVVVVNPQGEVIIPDSKNLDSFIRSRSTCQGRPAVGLVARARGA